MRNSPHPHDGIALAAPQCLAGAGRRRPSMSDPPRRGYYPSRLPEFFEATLRALGDWVRRIVARSKRRAQARATRRALSSLDAHALRDLGFDRSEITSVAAEIAGDADPTRVSTLQARPGLPF
jgi:uncharacterized protein YjiS (DUF1127 family)